MSKLLRVSEETIMTLEQLEKEMGISKQSILQMVLREYMRNRIVNGINESYATMRQNPEEWKEELEEDALWEAASNDELEDV